MADAIQAILKHTDPTRSFSQDEYRELSEEHSQLTLPFIPLRGVNAFPNVRLTFDIARQGSQAALKEAMAGNQLIFLTTQKDPLIPWPDYEELHEIGCIAKVVEVVDNTGQDNRKVSIKGLMRARVLGCRYDTDVPQAVIEPIYMVEPDQESSDRLEAHRREMMKVFQSYAVTTGRISPDVSLSMQMVESISDLADLIASQLFVEINKKQELLELLDVNDRVARIVELLIREIRINQYEEELERKTRDSIDKGQKEYYLREQLKAIQEELGEDDEVKSASEQYLEQLAELDIPSKDRDKLEKQIRKLPTYPPNFPEAATLRTYLDTVFELPWGELSDENLSITAAKRQLEKDHYGLDDVKERILEFLAVRKLALQQDQKLYRSPIICLVGPPGVGKTSIAQSIAKAMKREYVRMSLGGIRDEAEIRGHRRTYIGALPGRIIQAIRQAGTDNPLILLDEIDKLASDFRGDPSSALLEVLDPEQNNTFRDNYLELQYDLSHVLFVTTANNEDQIPDALRDRMELIQLSGYTEHEKAEIARRHLLPKTRDANALLPGTLRIPSATLYKIIQGYTMEAGVRQLERELSKLCRKVALQQAEEADAEVENTQNSSDDDSGEDTGSAAKTVTVTPARLSQYLGKAKYRYKEKEKLPAVGVCTGLAWTPAGGDTLNIEVSLMPGKGKVTLTGHLGDIMQESAHVALAYLRSRGESLGIEAESFEKKDIHMHVPEGATPKDGPSAGITLATALASAYTGRAISPDLAMTGEMTLSGRILAIGGLKEKLIAADRVGLKQVVIPEDNVRDLDEVPESVKEQLKIIPAAEAWQVFDIALGSAQ